MKLAQKKEVCLSPTHTHRGRERQRGREGRERGLFWWEMGALVSVNAHSPQPWLFLWWGLPSFCCRCSPAAGELKGRSPHLSLPSASLFMELCVWDLGEKKNLSVKMFKHPQESEKKKRGKKEGKKEKESLPHPDHKRLPLVPVVLPQGICWSRTVSWWRVLIWKKKRNRGKKFAVISSCCLMPK